MKKEFITTKIITPFCWMVGICIKLHVFFFRFATEKKKKRNLNWLQDPKTDPKESLLLLLLSVLNWSDVSSTQIKVQCVFCFFRKHLGYTPQMFISMVFAENQLLQNGDAFLETIIFRFHVGF